MKEEPSGKAIASLVFGILAVAQICPCIGGILAIALGSGDPSGMARAGVILGWISIITVVILLLFGALFLAVSSGIAAFG